MKKIVKKIQFVLGVVKLGADFKSKIKLFFESMHIQKNFYIKGENHPFHCWIGNNKRKAMVYFQGTLDDMHALTEIFVDNCYDPHSKNVHQVLDLGANIGLFSVWAWINFPNCIIHSYEPDPEIYKLLEKNLSPLSNVKTFNRAIADKEGTIEFYVSKRSFSSSIYPLSGSKVISIPTKKLDQVISDIGGTVDLMKIDIEGAEFSVLENSKQLDKINFIVGEVHPEKANTEVKSIENSLSKTHHIDSNINFGKSLFRATRFN